jgi:acyl-CoA thioesterase-2
VSVRPVLSELLELLRLERIEENLFRGPSQDLGWGQVFGGQVLGQALSAAAQTVPAERKVHSLHAYFLRTGDAKRPIVYTVDPIRDGRSFTTRRVVAVQGGRPIFHLAASFQIEEDGFEHHDEMPTGVPAPETLQSERELAQRLAGVLPAALVERATAERPIELKPVDPSNPLKPDVRAPVHQVWFKASSPLPDDVPAIHRYLLAYASDFSFLTTALRPHGVSWLTPGMQVASLDHAMWFHRPFRFDDWLLYDVRSPSASNARGLVQGRVFDRQGALVATVVQEGLIRDRRRG